MENEMRKFTSALLAGLLLAGTSAMVSAAETGVGDAPWDLKARIYFWLPDAPIDILVNQMNVGNLPESLDSILEGLQMAFMGEFELVKGPLTFFVSPIYYNGKVHRDFVDPFGDTRRYSVAEKVWLVDYGVGWAFGPWNLSEGADSATLTLTPYFGARYFHDPVRLNVPPGANDPGLSLKNTIAFNTGIAGLRANVKISDKWSFGIAGDVGVFDANEVKKTWQTVGTVNYHFKIKNTPSVFFVGYRYLVLDVINPPVEADIVAKGPLLGIGFEW